MVAETFQLKINISGSLTDGASKAQPSASCKTLKSHKTVIRQITFSKLKDDSEKIKVTVFITHLTKPHYANTKKQYLL